MAGRGKGYASEERFDLQRMVAHGARATPDKVALKEQGEVLTYAQLDDLVDRIAHGLAQRGIGPGDAVVSALPNYREAVALFFAIAKLGAVLVPCNSLAGSREASERVLLTDPKAVFVSCREAVDFMRSCAAPCPLVVSVRFRDDRCTSFSELACERAGSFSPVPVDAARDTLAVVFTSGSTGQPKGIELSHEALFWSGYNYGEALRAGPEDVFAMAMPVSHLFGLNAGVILPIMHGATVLLVDKFVPREMLALVERERASVLYGVPTMFAREIEAMDEHPYDMGSLRTGLIGGANCPESLITQIRDVLHCNVVVGYGSTEAGAVSATAMDDPVSLVTTTVGKAFSTVCVRVVDPAGRMCATGQGELVCKSPCAMKGLYRQPDATARVLRDGWVHTGDAASIGDDGYIRVLGRIDGMIIRGGYNIYASELEHVYSAHPDVVECCAFAVPHDELGQQTCLAARLRAGAQADLLALRAYARGKIAKYKIPDHVVVLDELPKLPTGKVDLPAVREACFAELSARRA